MATKAQFATETIGLWETQRGALQTLDNAEKAVCSAIEKGDKDFSLLAYLQVQSNTMFKVLVEGVAIAVQPLDTEQQAEVDALLEQINAHQDSLDNFSTLHETAIIKAVKEKTLTETLALWKDMPERIQADLDKAASGISALRVVNVQKANAHVAQSYQKRRVSPGSNGNSHNLPGLAEGQTYSITRSKQVLTLVWRGAKNWHFAENGETVAVSRNYPNLSITSWTMVGRIMRVLAADYAPKDNSWVVKKGDLSHKRFAQVKAGGVKPLSVTVIK